ncbi:Galactofuranosyl transferase GlfT2 [Aliarcobacter thereius]|uniref:glycosyltransferase n=1 Tax=Aliarcobacter thereius TaxID=544718 RepID=UPI00082867F1|nr:glycosyltransferase [Aliarcobacter thereius]OCL87036.1 Galactofuranosyl transferase GlfT2 [Aliarcobacter thereius]
MNKISVSAVLVTYGDRISYLEKVITKLEFIPEIENIIVVDNNSSSFDKIAGNFKKLKWIRLNKNTGSSNGYKVGIKEAFFNTNCNFIWLLDDDNLPDDDALNILIKKYYEKKMIDNNEMIAVQSRRPNYSGQQIHYIDNSQLNYNDFLGFSIRNIIKKIKNYKSLTNTICNCEIKVDYTQYGGILLSRRIIEIIGFPNGIFFLYSDDAEYTYRITNSGGIIYIVNDSIVKDIDFSWNNTSNKKNLLPILTDGNEFRVYYSVRNQIYFQKNFLVNNNIIFFLNGISYFSILFILSLVFFKLNRFKTIFNAFKDGLLGKMGENNKYGI